MNRNDLEKLHEAVERLALQPSFISAVEDLKIKLDASRENFVWTTIDLKSIDVELPDCIKSCWIFLLRRGAPSGSHYHPNSVQHMIAINGRGRSIVGGVCREIVPYDSPGHSIEEKWHIIEQGAPHEFFPEGEDMAVVSFHTCEAEELEEIAADTGDARIYEQCDSQSADNANRARWKSERE